MPDSVNRPTDLIIGASLITAEAIAQELRQRLTSRLTRRRYTQWELLTIARNLLREYEPILAENLANADLASWVAGVDAVVKKMPGHSLAAFLRGGSGTMPPIDVRTAFGELPGQPIVRFPLLERARESLLERNIVTRDEFDRLSEEAKQRAFTAAYIDSEETLEDIRDALAETLEQGPSLRVFREKIEAAIGASPIGPAHIELIYRTNIQQAFSDGLDTIADHPIVSEIFPFQEFLPIRDARARHDHVELGTLGLNGTGIYYRSDPVWSRITPPISWNCRCGRNLLTVDAAARKGVAQAKEWLRTGQPPAVPEYRDQFVDYQPPRGFVVRARAAA